MMRWMMILMGVAALTACEAPKKAETPEKSAPAPKPAAETAPAAQPGGSPVAAAKTMAAAAAEDMAAAVDELADDAIAVEADFEEEADAQITAKTYKSELDMLEKAITSEATE